MKQANFHLSTWASICYQLQYLTKADNIADSNTTVSVLVLLWNINTDTLHFAVKTTVPDNNTWQRNVQ